jgi:hypothetical protein
MRARRAGKVDQDDADNESSFNAFAESDEESREQEISS